MMGHLNRSNVLAKMIFLSIFKEFSVMTLGSLHVVMSVTEISFNKNDIATIKVISHIQWRKKVT